MIKNSKSIYSVEERLAIYRAARDIYDIYAKDHNNVHAAGMFQISGGRACYGMCRAIRDAMPSTLDPWRPIRFSSENFPEYFSYRPVNGWKQQDAYWWTLSIKNGGLKRRREIFNRLAEGLSKGE